MKALVSPDANYHDKRSNVSVAYSRMKLPTSPNAKSIVCRVRNDVFNTYPNLSATTSSRRRLVMTSHSFPAHIKKTNTLVSSLFNSLIVSVYLFLALALTMHANFMKSYKNRTYIKKIYSNLLVFIEHQFFVVSF